MNEVPVIELAGVCFSYDGAPVLEDVCLNVRRGEFVCVVGPNGGGKTTLLKLILGLLEPDHGQVRVFGRPARLARRRIGYMPQHAQLDLQFPVTVMDVVLMGRLGSGTRLGRYGRRDQAVAGAALQEVSLYELRARPFAVLSGGQRQRVLIARALACEPELLLLDEPTSNLDLQVEGEFQALLDELHQRLTIVLVSHDVSFVSKSIQNVICVNRRVVVHPTGEISAQAIRRMYGPDVRMVQHDHEVHGRGGP